MGKDDTLRLSVVDAMFLRWPTEPQQCSRMAGGHIPRLVLVDSRFPPPEPLDCLEGWICLPALECDVQPRMDGLLARSRAHLRLALEIGAHAILRFGSGWVSLPPVEAGLAGVLVVRFGAVAGRDTRRGSAWPGKTPTDNALDARVFRLRRRFAPLGLAIRTVRSEGHMLECADPPDGHGRELDLQARPTGGRGAATAGGVRG
jgi:hypothetical protein